MFFRLGQCQGPVRAGHYHPTPQGWRGLQGHSWVRVQTRGQGRQSQRGWGAWKSAKLCQGVWGQGTAGGLHWVLRGHSGAQGRRQYDHRMDQGRETLARKWVQAENDPFPIMLPLEMSWENTHLECKIFGSRGACYLKMCTKDEFSTQIFKTLQVWKMILFHKGNSSASWECSEDH